MYIIQYPPRPQKSITISHWILPNSIFRGVYVCKIYIYIHTVYARDDEHLQIIYSWFAPALTRRGASFLLLCDWASLQPEGRGSRPTGPTAWKWAIPKSYDHETWEYDRI